MHVVWYNYIILQNILITLYCIPIQVCQGPSYKYLYYVHRYNFFLKRQISLSCFNVCFLLIDVISHDRTCRIKY